MKLKFTTKGRFIKASNNEIINSTFGGEGVILRLTVNSADGKLSYNTAPIQSKAAFIQTLCVKHLGQLNLHHPDNNYSISAKKRHIGTLKVFLLYKCF